MLIFKQKDGTLSTNDAMALAALLIKAGYTVTIRKLPGKDGTGVEAVENRRPGIKEGADDTN